MTDRDLFYCIDFWCDGHARSNETCASLDIGLRGEAVIENDEPSSSTHSHCDRKPGVTHTAADHDACERRRIEALRKNQPETTYTVYGNEED